MKKLIRDSVSKIEPYLPGKPSEVLKRELVLKEEICKLASNENPLGPSPLAIAAIQKSLKEANLYPDNSCYYLKERLAEHLLVFPENLRIGNGSTELILLLGITFLDPDDTFVMSQSSFIMAKIVTQIIGCKLVEVPLKKYRHDLDAILESITSDTKIVYLDNPMNPIGTMTTHNEISKFMERLPEDVVVVLDEAYHDYVNLGDYPESLHFVEEGKNVIVLRTFSKMYGLAGFRVGYGVAKKEFIHAFDMVSPPFSVNRLGQIAAAEALEDKDHVQKTKEINKKGKEYLYRHFEKLDIFYIPSETNFVTIDLKTETNSIADELQKKGIIVRPLSMYGQPTLLRITIGTPEQNKRFMDAFAKIYKKDV
ncbi:MAG: histidinol-phosphate transaminase [Candidatus Aminicenantes bacterium]|nr:MAG: histidinol-phosphate transaminase [Candidatus Aminicenantes bacterium]